LRRLHFFGPWEERLFLRQKKSTIFFHARISRSGTGRVSDFSAKYFFFGEDGIFFAKLAFLAVICGIPTTFTPHINLKLDYSLVLARREF
jgi:hypothetical protein